MHRVLFAIHRKPELSYEEFMAHYRDVHLPIARKLPKLRQYDIFPVQPGAGPDGDTPDAFTFMTFDSAEDFDAFLAAPEMADIAKDNETFIGRVEAFTVDHIPVIAG